MWNVPSVSVGRSAIWHTEEIPLPHLLRHPLGGALLNVRRDRGFGLGIAQGQGEGRAEGPAADTLAGRHFQVLRDDLTECANLRK